MTSDTDLFAKVELNGWQAISISDAPQSFVYTLGLPYTFDHPELLVFDPDPQAGYSILAAMVYDISKDRSFRNCGHYKGVLVEGEIAIRSIHPTQYEFYLGYAMGHFRHTYASGEFRALQVFWPDVKGNFPFDSECNEAVYLCQPRLDVQLSESEIQELRQAIGDN